MREPAGGQRRLSVMRIGLVVGFIALVLTGCDEAGSEAPPATTWQEPARYDYTVRSSCGERLLIGTFKLTVVDGKVTEVTRSDADSVGKPENYPTLGDLLDEYTTAKSKGAHVAKLETDPVDGHPTRIDLDPMQNAIDDEACYVISNYAPRG